MSEVPGTFGPYELVGEIARGAAGVVHRARPRSGGPDVALKMLRDEPLSRTAAARFRREARVAARLRHPNIVPVLDAGEVEGRAFFTMPIVEGRSLAQALAGEPFPRERIATILAKVARAVHHAHEEGVVHRDLKPTNILLRPDDEPMVGDFGVARDRNGSTALTVDGELLGTPAYMAPEQIAGRAREADGRADVYALGAVLYRVLAGRPPFEAVSFVELSVQVLSRDPEPPSRVRPGADPELERLCLKCLRKDPARRYATAAALAEALERIAGRAAETPSTPLGFLLRGRRARKRVAVLAIVWVLSLAAGGAVLLRGSAASGTAPDAMVTVDAFWIDRHEVSVAEYARFVEATGHRTPPTWRRGRPPRNQERRPVSYVSWDDAAAYARWAGKRLPTAEEWRRAARGLSGLEARQIVCAETALDTGPCAVDEGEDLSAPGALHLGGNVAEWTATPGSAGERMRVVCGGHWRAPAKECRAAAEREMPSETREPTIGFRCAASPR